MKNISIIFLMIFLLLLSVYLAVGTGANTKSADSSKVFGSDNIDNKQVNNSDGPSVGLDLKKVGKYIGELESFIKKHKDYIEDKATGENVVIAEKELVKIFDKYKLNDDEVLEVLNYATKEHDVQKIVNIWASGDTTIPYDKDIALKYNIFVMTKGNYFERPWFGLPEEEVLMNKILPILNKSKNSAVIRYYVIRSGGIFRDIWNKDLPISDENRDKFSDKYIEIFIEENNLLEIRQLSIDGWTVAERRSEKAIEYLEYVAKNEDLFELSATYFWNFTPPKEYNEMVKRLPTSITSKFTQKIEIKMFNILQKNESYSKKILNGVLEYFLRSVSSFSEDSKKLLINILNKKLEKETDQNLREKYQDIINYSNEKE